MATVTETIHSSPIYRVTGYQGVVGIVSAPTAFSRLERGDALPSKAEPPAAPAPAPEPIKTLRFVCPWYGDIPEEVQIIMRINQTRIEAAGHIWDLRRFGGKGSPEEAAVAKDFYLLDIMRREDDIAGLDGDLEIKSIFLPPRDGRPWAIWEWGAPRIGYVIQNGCKEFFDYLDRKRRERGYRDAYGMPNKLFRDEDFGEIHDSTYTHYRLTSGVQHAAK